MKKSTHVLIICLLVALGGISVSAQVGRRTTERSERVVVPLELPEPPSGLRHVVDVEEGATVRCACLERQEEPCSGEEPSSERHLRGTEVDVKAIVLDSPEPRYTREARQNETQGRVILEVVLGSSGKVSSIKVLEGLPDGLTGAGIAAACGIEFEPARKNGQAVSQLVKIEYNFNLDVRFTGPGRPRMGPRSSPPLRRMPPIMLPPPLPFESSTDDEPLEIISPTGLSYGFYFTRMLLPSPPLPFGGLWPSCGWPSLF